MKRWLMTFVAAAALAASPAGAAAPAAASFAGARLVPVVALPVMPVLPALGAAGPLTFQLVPGRVDKMPIPAVVAAPPLVQPVLTPGVSAVGPAAAAGAPAAVPAGATALSRLQASALEGAGAARPEASAADAKSLSAQSFDGSAAAGDVSDGRGADAPGASAPKLPSYLDSPEPEQAAWIASVVAEAQRTPTGRAVLGRVARLAEKRGRPVIVVVAPIGNAGEYAFDHEIVTMDASHTKHPAVEAAPVFLHELAHVLQLSQGLPADAFEMELEAYLIQFRLAEELGYKPKRGTFHWSAFRRFKNDVDRFMAWLLKEYDGNLAIVGKGSLESYEAKLDERHAEAQARLERLEKRAASKRRVIERMAATGQPAHLVEQYRLDELAPLEEKLRVQRRELGWLERDLLLLRTPESRERYRRYAERVLKKARAYHARLNAAG